jgi:osmoprotectant transport system permease protein
MNGRAPPAGTRGPLQRLVVGIALYAGILSVLPFSEGVFRALFPGLDRPLYRQHGFLELVLAHAGLVAAASAGAALIGVSTGVFVTREAGRAFRRLLDSTSAMAQTIPPVAVLALSVPVIGFGFWPAFLALVLYGILPISENTVAGIESVPPPVRDAARGLGMSPLQVLARVELPLAAPVLLAGIRTSVTIAIGTAAIASTVGAVSLGSPIIIGLNGSNTAYVLQGALLVAGLALVVDLAFEALIARARGWTER